MVDPCRNLTKEQLAFLRECEEEFKHRYTEADAQYRAALTQETEDPPCVDPWKKPRQWQHRGGHSNQHASQNRGQKRPRNYY